MRVIATGGGTGGHVYPALSILAALRERLQTVSGEELDVLYVGSQGGLEAGIVRRTGLAFRTVPSGAVVGSSPLKAAANLVRTLAGVVASWRLLRDYRPQAVLATGGYVTVPVVLAAALARVPSLIFLPDATPGMAVRFLSRFADRITVTLESTRGQLPSEKTVATGYPVRQELFGIERFSARKRLGLAETLPLVVVLGGSRGSRSINEAVHAAWQELLPVCQILHVAGLQDEPWLQREAQRLPVELRARYHVFAYLHDELPDALAAADVVVSRAGASVLGEYPAVGAASVLVPYPYAGAHQRLNAEQLVAAGAALAVEDETLAAGVLGPTIIGLLGDNERLAQMRAAAQQLARPHAAQDIADILIALVQRQQRGRMAFHK
ncbi:MAG: undecaprenyldiphospho-muramoylpentapeptide beta-N-acetylglucosaminyltransferase [Chloroflexota bacterium]